MLLYYITDRRRFPGSAADQRAALLRKISQAAHCGVDYIQLREKDLTARELLELAEEAHARIRDSSPSALATRLLINSRMDVALAGGADGVHLRSDDISAADARAAWMKAAAAGHWPLATGHFTIACSCHTVGDVRRAESEGADFAVFAPVFEKSGERGVGLEALRAACRGSKTLPVLALGGVTPDNAPACLEAGAAGMAGIRLFQDYDIAEIVSRLRRNLTTSSDAK
jgi:thiamine-phosphate pyrophosphorylase